MVINVASFRNNGNPTTEEVINHYHDKLNIKHIIFTETERDEFAIASKVKDRQIASSNCDWILNPDADHVYHPEYFSGLLSYLEDLKNCERCAASLVRVTTDEQATNEAVNTSGIYIDDAYNKAMSLKRIDRKLPIRFGSFVAFRRDAFNKICGGVYDTVGYDKHLFKQGMGSRSDKRFRARMNGTIRLDLPPYVHLNHSRDKDAGKHLEEQR